MKATQASIDSFLSTGKIAIAGVSRDPKKFGHLVFKTLREKGFDVCPIHPDAENIAGVPCYHSAEELPSDVHSLLILTPKKQARDVVAGALRKGINNIWIQQMCDTPEAVELTKSESVNLITKECILMHIEPVSGIHKFHRTIQKLFGAYPK